MTEDVETSTLVLKVLAWLPRVPPEVGRALLVGCGFHDGVSDTPELATVVDADAVRGTVLLSGAGRPVSLRRFRDGEFVDTRPGSPLAAAVDAARTEGELRDEAERLALRRAGFEPGKLASGEARRAVLAVLEANAAGSLPGDRLRATFHEAVSAADDREMARAALRVIEAAIGRFELAGAVPEDMHWRRAVLLRRAGRLREAVEVSEVLWTRRDWSPEARLFLASTRAGSLLQLAEMQPEAGLLEEAERALKVAWAAKPGDEALRAMWRTLDRLAGRDRDGRSEDGVR